MKIIRKLVLTSLGLLPFLGPMDVAYSAEKNDNDPTENLLTSVNDAPWRKARFSIEAQSGTRTIGTLDAMVPFMGNDDFMVYADAIAKFGTGANNQNGNTWEGNLGLGVRRINDSETAIYGAYLFYDYLNSVNQNTFTQATIGVERLGMTWDFRANAYIPFGKTSATKNVYKDGNVVIDQHNLIEYYKTQTETATAGGDIEIGRTLGSQKFRGYLAAYSFGSEITGPRVRFEYQLNQHFALNAAVQYDKTRGAQYFFGARFTIGGAQAKNTQSIYQRLTTSVVRDVDVVTKMHSVDTINVEHDRFWLVDLDKSEAGGSGTVDNPYSNLDEALQQAPEGAIIFIKGNGSTTTLGDGASLKSGQILWGGDKPLYWDFDQARPVFSPTLDALLIHEGDGLQKTFAGTLHMADNSGVYNLGITSSGINSGIVVDNQQHVTIDNVTLSGFTSGNSDAPLSAITINGGEDISINNVNLHANDIGLSVNGGQVTINNSTLAANNYAGLNVTGGSVISNDSHYDNNLGHGIAISGGSAHIIGGTINTSAQQGINVTGGDITLQDSQVGTSNQNGVNVDGGTAHVINSNIIQSQQNGINVLDGVLDIIGSNIDGNQQNGIQIQGGTNTIVDTTIQNSVVNGVKVMGEEAFVTINHSNITLNKNHGLSITEGATAVVNDSTFSQNSLDSLSNAQSVGELISAIQIDGTLIADHLTVDNNAAGIELIAGKLTLTGNNGMSVISNNTGYGLHTIQPADKEVSSLTREANISNTQFINTKQLNGDVTTGHGLWAENIDTLTLNNVELANNQGNGLWIQSGKATGNNIVVSKNGVDNSTEELDKHGVGIRVDNLGDDNTDINFINTVVNDNFNEGVLINGGSATFTSLTSSNNLDGLMLTNGMVNLYSSDIYSNKRMGIYVRKYNPTQEDGYDIYRQLVIQNSKIHHQNQNDQTMFNVDGVPQGSGHGMVIDAASVVDLLNNHIYENVGHGIYQRAGTLMINGDSVATGEAYKSIIENNGKDGISSIGNTDPYSIISVSNTLINENAGKGLNLPNTFSAINLDHVTISNNDLAPLFISANNADNVTISYSTFNNNMQGKIEPWFILDAWDVKDASGNSTNNFSGEKLPPEHQPIS